MDIYTRKKLVSELQKQYTKKTKREKGQIIQQLVCLTGYHPTYAAFLLSRTQRQPIHRTRKKISKYTSVILPLKRMWRISNYACGKRLIGMLPTYIETLTRDGELSVTGEQKRLLLMISAATIERLISTERKTVFGKGRTTTRPGTLLKQHIPIHLFTRWDARKPGFGEIDLVAHCGITVKGEFAYTLDFIDLDTNWNECYAFLGRGEHRAMKGMQTIRERLPFPLLGIDSDNGEEFINWQMYHWCRRRKITFTRCREYHKNDQAHVEEKNWSVVRRYTGYKRFETQREVDLLNKLYEVLRLYFNFFQATMKLERKERIGGKVKRIYSKAKTPYQRVLEHTDIPEKSKELLRKQHQILNPAQLLRQIDKITDQLISG